MINFKSPMLGTCSVTNYNRERMFLVTGQMSKELYGILEQVFIDQTISKIERMKFELMSKSSKLTVSNDDTKKWCMDKINELNDLIVQFDQTQLGNNLNHLINRGLDSFWDEHSDLNKSDVLFCGVLATMSSDAEAAQFLQIDMNDFSERKVEISRQLELKTPFQLRGYVLGSIKRLYETEKR